MSWLGPIAFGLLFTAGALLWLLASRGSPQKKPREGIRSTLLSRRKK